MDLPDAGGTWPPPPPPPADLYYVRPQAILGPMFSGKTEELDRVLMRHRYAGQDVLLAKYAKDTRYTGGAKIQTHSRRREMIEPEARQGRIGALRIVEIERVADLGAFGERILGIDEGQFLPDLAAGVNDLALIGIRVIVAALSGTYQRKPFQAVADFQALCAPETTYQTAVCMVCQAPEAPFSARTVENSELEVIGGAEAYSAVCPRCFDRVARV